MKKSKLFARIFSVLLCSVLTASAMSGCGNKGGESSTPSQSSDSSSSSTGSGSSSDGKGDLYIEGSEGVTLTYWIPIGSTARLWLSTPTSSGSKSRPASTSSSSILPTSRNPSS